MIGYVRGIVTHLFKESCYVDVHGVGYRVYVPTTTRQQLTEGHEATLFTYLNVREDAMQLYGFWTEEEYELFILLISVSGTFREDTDGNAGFDLVDGCEDGLESLFDILTVKKQTVKIFHPVGKKRITLHFFLGNVAGTDRTAAVSKHDVKITSVIANVENRSILGNIFFADDRNFGSGFPENEFKYSLDNSKRTDFLGPW